MSAEPGWLAQHCALEDVFDLQDQITDRVVGIVEPSLQRSEIERSRRKRPKNLDAHDLYLRALPYTASQTPQDASIAAGFLEEALKLEPDYAAAHAILAWCHEWRFMRGGYQEADKIAGLRHARAAIATGTDDAAALAVGGFVIMLLDKDRDTALSAIERALSVNPSCAFEGCSGVAEPILSAGGRAMEQFSEAFVGIDAARRGTP